MEGFLIRDGYIALILFGFPEACCVPMSSEVTFGFGGVLAYQGHLSLTLLSSSARSPRWAAPTCRADAGPSSPSSGRTVVRAAPGPV